MNEPESPQGEWGARRAGRPALAPAGLSEEWAECEPETPQGEWAAMKAGRLAAPRAGAGIGGVPGSWPGERAPEERAPEERA